MDHSSNGMAGIVMGIVVAPRRGQAFTDADAPRRRLRLVAFADSGFPDSAPSMRFRLAEPRAFPGYREARPGYSPPIQLTRGEPVSIMIVNTMREPTTVHWHGMELESYYDGVAGFGGQGPRISPIIAPNDSFEVRFTPPRSGTFMYHSHVQEMRQHPAGLLGALIVRDPGAPAGSELTFMLKGPRSRPLTVGAQEINGQMNPDTVSIPAGQPTRFRLMSLMSFNPNATFNLTARRDSVQSLREDSLLVRWSLVAKDGADLAKPHATPTLARQRVSMGESYDFLYTPPRPGDLRLEVRSQGGALLVRVPIRVR
jgi:FtsP/CotA-like multicopper oxidase with cupredoxin domain